MDMNYYSELDVLEHWKNQQKRYPDLSIMASDVLSIPITTVASESAFSIGARILTKYRSSLHPNNVEALVCTRNWLKGYDVEGSFVSLNLDNSFTLFMIFTF